MGTPDDQPHRPHKTNLPCDSAKAPHFLTTWPRPRPPPHPHAGLTFTGNIRIPRSGPVHMHMSHVAFTCQHAHGRQQQTHSQTVMERGHGAEKGIVQALQAVRVPRSTKRLRSGHLRLLISEDFPAKGTPRNGEDSKSVSLPNPDGLALRRGKGTHEVPQLLRTCVHKSRFRQESGRLRADSRPPSADCRQPGADPKQPGADSAPPGADSRPPGADLKATGR